MFFRRIFGIGTLDGLSAEIVLDSSVRDVLLPDQPFEHWLKHCFIEWAEMDHFDVPVASDHQGQGQALDLQKRTLAGEV